MSVILAALLAQAATPSAQGDQVAETEHLDSGRLAAAKLVIETVFPVSQREQMMAAMVGSVTASMKAAIANQPDIVRLIQAEPKARAVFERFAQSQQARSVMRMQAGLPGMTAAMTRAYARCFSTDQLNELRTFFETPTGRAYVLQSATIMADPDVSAWQSKMLSDSTASMGPDIRQLVQELTALAPAGKAK